MAMLKPWCVADPVEDANCLAFALFAEPRVGKAWAKRLEEDTRSRRACRHVHSLLADAAAIAAAIILPQTT